MSFTLEIMPCDEGMILPVIEPGFKKIFAGHIAQENSPIFSVNAGCGNQVLEKGTGRVCFTLQFKSWLSDGSSKCALLAPFLKAMRKYSEKVILEAEISKSCLTAAIITLSDKGAEGLRQDKSGPALREMLEAKFQGILINQYILPDEAEPLEALLIDLALCQRVNLIVTNGGTGVSPRDITPQVTAAIIDRELPGFSFMMMKESAVKTPHAAISRAVCGILGSCIIINVPGSVRGATENLQAVLPALPHALAKLNGDTEDCGG